MRPDPDDMPLWKQRALGCLVAPVWLLAFAWERLKARKKNKE